MLLPNPSKSVVCVIYLANKQEKEELMIYFDGNILKQNLKPIYFGVTLDRSFTFLSKCSQKLKIPNNFNTWNILQRMGK